MKTHQKVFRAIGLSAAATAIAAIGVVLPGSPASARPIDCSLTVVVERVTDYGLQARAKVVCPSPEHFTVHVYLRREDRLSNPVVDHGSGDSNGGRGPVYAYATEPCSDVQTNKTYHATAKIMDTTYHYPIEVKEAKSDSVRGNC